MSVWSPPQSRGRADPVAKESVAREILRLDSTILKGLSMIEVLANAASPMGVTALGRALDLQKSNVHRTLQTLVEAGYVERDEATGRYALGLKIWELGTRVVGRNQLRRIARSFMRALHQETSENIYLVLLKDTDVLYLETIDAIFPLRPMMKTGARTPAVFPATGKAVLAFRPDRDVLVATTIATVKEAASLDRKKVLKELATIRRTGFAISVGGWTAGMTSIAAPIMSVGRPPVAALGLGGPSERVTPEHYDRLSKAVMNAATCIADMIGDSP
jgi:IclR family KDG regulon transcriptional repressor